MTRSTHLAGGFSPSRANFGPLLRVLWVLLCLVVCAPGPVAALVRFDFETPNLVHPGRQVWDFCLIRQDAQYHAFYHTIAQQTPQAANADTIWHAVSPDLKSWDIQGPVLTSGPDWWDEAALWAPDVVYDDQSERWAMLYTGVGAGMVQRACLAWSDDLVTWTKSLANPVFEPDSLTYHWTPTQTWSSFRDPFVFHDGQQWNMLSTAALRLGGFPGYRRGIVHRAVSSDLETWQDAGVFYEHDGATGRTFDLESVQYVVREGWHHLFFVEQDLNISDHATSHMVAADPQDWTMAQRTYLDPGWAPEIKRFDATADADIFARLTKGLDPRDYTWFVVARFDSVRFGDGGLTPEVFRGDGQDTDWPLRQGDAGLAAPTFGDNPALRLDPPAGPTGHGWFGSGEYYGGPLSYIGLPGGYLGDRATGRLESRPFVVTGRSLRLLLAGGFSPDSCYVALLDDTTGEILSRIHPTGETLLTERSWDIHTLTGRTVRLALVDAATGPDGWLAVDAIEELAQTVSSTPEDNPPTRLAGLQAFPNPFNGGTVVRGRVPQAGQILWEVFDLRGRRVWRSAPEQVAAGEVSVGWDARDSGGRALASGTYLCRLLLDGIPTAGTRLSLVE